MKQHWYGVSDGSVTSLPSPWAATTQKGTIPQQDSPTRTLQLLAVHFDGILQVIEPSAFTAALVGGIGSGKAWGCGLLSLAPART